MFREMHYEIIVKPHLGALIHEMTPVGNATTVWDVATLNIEPLACVVARMQPHSDANYSRMPCRFRFRAVEQSGRNAFSAEFREHIEVLNLRNVQVNKSGITRFPVYRHIPGELPVKGCDEARPGSRHLFAEVALVLSLRLVPPHVPERSSDGLWIAFFEKSNANELRFLHA